MCVLVRAHFPIYTMCTKSKLSNDIAKRRGFYLCYDKFGALTHIQKKIETTSQSKDEVERERRKKNERSKTVVTKCRY